MSNAGHEANAEGAVEVAIDDEVDVIDKWTASSEHNKRGIVYHRRNTDHHRTSAGNFWDGKQIGG